MTVLNATQTNSTPQKTYKKKLFYRIQEAADIAGLEPHVLRYWETQFRELSPEKDRSGHRRYRQDDIDCILHIRELLHEQKFTVAGARKQLKDERKQPAEKKEPRKSRVRSAKRDTLLGIRNELTALMNRLSA